MPNKLICPECGIDLIKFENSVYVKSITLQKLGEVITVEILGLYWVNAKIECPKCNTTINFQIEALIN